MHIACVVSITVPGQHRYSYLWVPGSKPFECYVSTGSRVCPVNPGFCITWSTDALQRLPGTPAFSVARSLMRLWLMVMCVHRQYRY